MYVSRDRAFEDLANAIIVQAADDYRAACKRLKDHPGDRAADAMKTECEQFFRSEWYEFLTDVDGEYLLDRLRRETG